MAPDSMKQIPTINLRKLKANDPEEIEKLGEACHHRGFFRLTELDLREGAASDFLAAMQVFFGLPHAEKKQLSRTQENPWGYFDEELTKNNQDWKSTLNDEIINYIIDDLKGTILEKYL